MTKIFKFISDSVGLLMISLIYILITPMAHSATTDLNCVEAKDRLSHLLKTNLKSFQVQVLMDRVAQCIDLAAKGQPIPIQDIEMNVNTLEIIKSTPNESPILIASGLFPYCSIITDVKLLQSKKSDLHILQIHGKLNSCGPSINNVMTYQREIKIDSLKKGNHTIIYYPWGSSEGSYKELKITIH